MAFRRGRGRLITVKLDGSSPRNYGLELDFALEDESVSVAAVRPGGQVDEWNQRQNPDERVRPGLRVQAVNGERATPRVVAGLGQMRCEFEIAFSASVMAPINSVASDPEHSPESGIRFPVSVVSTVADGPGLSAVGDDHGVFIVEIREHGGVQEWNAAHPEAEVTVGDRIVFVNGETGHRGMTSALCAFRDETLHMVIRRGRCSGSAEVLPRSIIRALPLVDPNNIDSPTDCGICCQDLAARGRVVQLACSHMFHRRCAKQWLMKHSQLCPLCKWAADHPAAPGRRPSYLAAGDDAPFDCDEGFLEGERVSELLPRYRGHPFKASAYFSVFRSNA